MSIVNINRANTDSFYRYKMPRLLSKVEGKGNGIKTVIPNMEEIARCLSRPPSYPTKFFGCELGAQTQMDDKNSRFIVNGAHDEKTLSDLLDKFIKKFVLCQNCSNPETVMLIDRKEDIWLDCKACGAHMKVDMLHKFCVFVLKNPPPNSHIGTNSSSAKQGKKSKEERRREKNERAKNGAKRASDSDDDAAIDDKPGDGRTGSDDGTKTPSNEPNTVAENDEEDGGSGLSFTPTITATTNGTSALSAGSGTTVDINEEFTVDEATLAQSRKELTDGLNAAVKNLVVSKDDEANEGDEASDAYEDFAKFLGSPHTVEEIKSKIVDAHLKEDKAMAVLVQVSFSEKILEELPEKKQQLVHLVKSEKSVKGLIGGLERLVGITHPSLISKFVKILKYLYDNDILQEEAILAWNDKMSKKYVDKDIGAKLRAQAKPLIDWLKTAEEESE